MTIVRMPVRRRSRLVWRRQRGLSSERIRPGRIRSSDVRHRHLAANAWSPAARVPLRMEPVDRWLILVPLHDNDLQPVDAALLEALLRELAEVAGGFTAVLGVGRWAPPGIAPDPGPGPLLSALMERFRGAISWPAGEFGPLVPGCLDTQFVIMIDSPRPSRARAFHSLVSLARRIARDLRQDSVYLLLEPGGLRLQVRPAGIKG